MIRAIRWRESLPKGSHHSGGEVTNMTIVVWQDFRQAKVRNLIQTEAQHKCL